MPFSPTQGVGHRPIHGPPLPVNALNGIVGRQALLPQGQEDGCRCPLLEAAMVP
jgi:hypothetical protein